MAKSKEPVDKLACLKGMVKSAKDALGKTGGIRLNPYALQWVFDSELIRFGQIYVFYGPPSSGKSMGGYWVARQFLLAGGFVFILDTENKTSLATMTSIIGEDLMECGRFSYDPIGSMNAGKSKKDRVSKDADGNVIGESADQDETEEEKDEKVKGWMSRAAELINTIKKDAESRHTPVLIMLDSLLGAGTAEQEKKIQAAGGVVEGNETAAMRRAKLISDWLETFANKLAGTCITMLVVNHMSIEIAMSTIPGKANLPPKEKFVGGKALHHRAAFHVKFKSAGDIKKADLTGKYINITLSRNSFGDDTSKRVLTVPWIVDTQRGENNEMRFDLGNNMGRVITWCWDLASANIVIERCTAGSDKSSAQMRSLFPGLKVNKTKGRVTCKSLGIEDVTLEEFGRLLTTRPDLRAKTQAHIKLTVTAARDTENVFSVDDRPAKSSVERAHELGDELESEEGDTTDATLGTAKPESGQTDDFDEEI